MKRLMLIAALALSACSDEPVGQSAYFDPWENPQAPGTTAPDLSAQVDELNRQVDQRRLENASRIAAADGDLALVASLDEAIATAGSQPRTSFEPGAQVGQTQVMTDQSAAQTAPSTVGIQGSGQISDNSFSTVVQTESIETDAARLAALSQSKVELQATPLPERDRSVNPAAFARSTTHNIGERVYKRKSRSSASKRCREYGNPDAAQRAFLAAGGPALDELRLDPDGDGFVCGWSPIPFRNLRVGG